MTRKQAIGTLIATGVVAAVLLLLGLTQEATRDAPLAYFKFVTFIVVLGLPVLWFASWFLKGLWGFTIFNVFFFIILRKLFDFTRQVFKTATIFVYQLGWQQVLMAFRNEPAPTRKPRRPRQDPHQQPTTPQKVPRLVERTGIQRLNIKGLLGTRKEKR